MAYESYHQKNIHRRGPDFSPDHRFGRDYDAPVQRERQGPPTPRRRPPSGPDPHPRTIPTPYSQSQGDITGTGKKKKKKPVRNIIGPPVGPPPDQEPTDTYGGYTNTGSTDEEKEAWKYWQGLEVGLTPEERAIQRNRLAGQHASAQRGADEAFKEQMGAQGLAGGGMALKLGMQRGAQSRGAFTDMLAGLELQQSQNQIANAMQKAGLGGQLSGGMSQRDIARSGLEQSGRQFHEGLLWDKDRFGQQLDWDKDKFGQSLSWDKDRFGQTMDFNRDQFDWRKGTDQRDFDWNDKWTNRYWDKDREDEQYIRNMYGGYGQSGYGNSYYGNARSQQKRWGGG